MFYRIYQARDWQPKLVQLMTLELYPTYWTHLLIWHSADFVLFFRGGVKVCLYFYLFCQFIKQAWFKLMWNLVPSLVLEVCFDQWTYIKMADFLFGLNWYHNINKWDWSILPFFFCRITRINSIKLRLNMSSTVMSLHCQQSRFNFSADAFTKRICFPLFVCLCWSSRKWSYRKMLSFCWINCLNWLHGYTNVIACIGGGGGCDHSLLKQLNFSFAWACQ